MQKLFTFFSNSTDPYYNLAVEEVLLSRVPADGIILYLWQNDHTVVIGRNQNIWKECRVALLQEENGKPARRLSGGGAVYHDLGNLNFTFLCPDNDYDVNKQLSVIQRAVSFAGIHAEFSGRNDLLTDGKKFSGNAFYHSKRNAYHHGTLLIDSDMEKLQRYLSPPKAKLESKGIASVRSRVVNLKELSPALNCEIMKTYMVDAFSQIYGLPAVPFSLTKEDHLRITELSARNADPKWLFEKQMAFSCHVEGRLSFGSVELGLFVDGGIIQDIQVYTDAMDTQLPDILKKALRSCPLRPEGITDALSHLDWGAELAKLIQEQVL